MSARLPTFNFKHSRRGLDTGYALLDLRYLTLNFPTFNLQTKKLHPDVILALSHPFVGGQLRQAHRAAGVQALG